MSYAYKGAAQILRDAYLGKLDRPLTGMEKIHCLDYCCEQQDFESARDLITNKATTSPIGDERNEKGHGLLLIIVTSKFTEDQKEILIKLLLSGKHKDDVNQKSKRGNTPLMLAATNCYEFIIIDLVKVSGIKINEKDAKGGAALHDAVKNYKSNNGGDRTGYIRAILSHKDINPNLRNDNGETPLHLTKDLKVAELLVEKGANQNAKDLKGNIPEIAKKGMIKPKESNEITTYQQLDERINLIEELVAQSRISYISDEDMELIEKEEEVYGKIKEETKKRILKEKQIMEERAFKLFEELGKQAILIRGLNSEKVAFVNNRYKKLGERINAIQVTNALRELLIVRPQCEKLLETSDPEKAGNGLINNLKEKVRTLELTKVESEYFETEFKKLEQSLLTTTSTMTPKK